MPAPVFGLTGGIACGKTTASAIFASLGVPIVDADQIAREIVQPGTQGLAAIVETFGPEVLADDGTLDRKRLGAIVFADPEKRAALEAITHPLIFVTGRERIARLAEAHPDVYVLYEAALLVETGGHRMFDGLVVVAAHRDVQRARLILRDGLTPEEADARLAAQLPIERKVEVADVVIWNDGDRQALERAVVEAHAKLLARAREKKT